MGILLFNYGSFNVDYIESGENNQQSCPIKTINPFNKYKIRKDMLK